MFSLAVAWPSQPYGELTELAWHTYGSGHLHGLSAPGLGLEIALEPDALHRETQRRLSSADQSQLLILERGYTELGQVDRLSLRGPGSAQDEQNYRYDALGRLSFRSSGQGSSSPVIAYTYDPAGRLIASQHGDRAHRYPVDAAGNRLEGQASAQPDNRLTQLDGARYRHDGAGNLIERETSNGERLSLGYDGANRLVRLTRTSAQGATEEARYRYDALGRRISKTVHHANGTTATTHYGWDGDRLVHEAKERHQTTVVYEPGSFVPMLRIDQAGDGAAKQISAYVTDALGTPMQLVTPRGDTLWQAQPDDWAAVTNEQGRTAQPIRFQGQWYDEESGLYYNRHRYYDPQQGRYISQDPIGLNGGTNLYGYVSNPTGMVDPLGLEGWSNLRSWQHYRNNGPDVTLQEIGHLSTIQNSSVTQQVLSRFGDQVKDAAEAICVSNGPGVFDTSRTFRNSYRFHQDVWFIGSATLSGEFSGTTTVYPNGAYTYTGEATINFYDLFTDPYDTFNWFNGEWNPDGSPYKITDQWSKTYQGGGMCR